jgi:predicted CXXCH cytochrome family protein
MLEWKRRWFIITTALSLFFWLYSSVAIPDEPGKSECIGCHRDIYEKAQKSPYTHSIVLTDCKICHIEEQTSKAIPKITLNTSTLLKDFILYIDSLDKNKIYKAEIVLSDESDNKSEPFTLEISPARAKDYSKTFKPLQNLSEVSIEEIRKRVFVNAEVSWRTDTPATTAVECRKVEGQRSSSRDEHPWLYSWVHRIEISGLSHKNKYLCKAISEDLFGNRIKSSEFMIDPTVEKKKREKTSEGKAAKLSVENAEFFRIEKKDGIFLWVKANRPSYCSVYFSESSKEIKKAIHHFTPGRHATIEVCEGCHTFTVSHPVGIKATTEQVKVPDDMFTIEDGIITCATCHSPHGGDRPFLARFDFKKDLCLKCHDESIYNK